MNKFTSTVICSVFGNASISNNPDRVHKSTKLNLYTTVILAVVLLSPRIAYTMPLVRRGVLLSWWYANDKG